MINYGEKQNIQLQNFVLVGHPNVLPVSILKWKRLSVDAPLPPWHALFVSVLAQKTYKLIWYFKLGLYIVVVTLSFNAKMDLANFKCNLKD